MNVAEFLNKTDSIINEINSCKKNTVLYGTRMDDSFKKYILFFLNIIKLTNGVFGHTIVPNKSVYNRVMKFFSVAYSTTTSYENYSSYEYGYIRESNSRFHSIDEIDTQIYNNLTLLSNGSYLYSIKSTDNTFDHARFIGNHIVNYRNGEGRYEIFLACSGTYVEFRIPYGLYANLLRNTEDMDEQKIQQYKMKINKTGIKCVKGNIYSASEIISSSLLSYFNNRSSSEQLIDNFKKIINIPVSFKEGE